jgi:NAD(P)H dehydrogenase (quinone)
LLVGVPFTEAALSNTQSGGTPYGASHVSGADGKTAFSDDENVIAKALGKRIAQISQKLSV